MLKYLGGNFAPCVVAHPDADGAVHLVGGGGRRLVAFSIGAHLYVFVDDLCECTYKNTDAGYAVYNESLLIYSCDVVWLKREFFSLFYLKLNHAERRQGTPEI